MDYECTYLLLSTIAHTGHIDRLTNPEFVEALGTMSFETQKAYLMTLRLIETEKTGFDLFTEPGFVTELSRESRTAARVYLWDMGSHRKFMSLSDWKEKHSKVPTPA
jgi:hypothetical protein